MMEEFKKEQLIKEKSEFDKEIELIRNIIKTREELRSDNKNFEFAIYKTLFIKKCANKLYWHVFITFI